jgi:hypothetical protein
MQRSVVCTETCPRRNWICSSSPPESWQKCVHEPRRSCGASRGIFMLAAVFLTTCQIVFSEMPCPHGLPARQTHRNSGPLSIPAAVNHASSVSCTQFGTGTVRMCLPLPMRSTIVQRSSRRCKLSSVSSASSRRRRPQPSRNERCYVVTIPGRGYRFAAPVRTVTEGSETLVAQMRSRTEITIDETVGEAGKSIPALPPLTSRGWKRNAIWVSAAALTVSAVIAVLVRNTGNLLLSGRMPILTYPFCSKPRSTMRS